MISSAIAGLATAPVGSAHFNATAQYGLIANLLSVPLMGALVIPSAVLAALLSPFGLEAVGLIPMGWGLGWILFVADWVSGLDGAQRFVVSPAPEVLPLLALGALGIILWQGRARWIGIGPMVVAIWLWAGAERPVVLVADSGGLVGVMTPEGRALSKTRGAGFAARNWLENDGDGETQAQAATRWPGSGAPVQRYQLPQMTVVHVIGKRGAEQISDCHPQDLVVASVPLSLTGGCAIYDPRRLRRTGSLAFQHGTLVTARSVAGQRLWTTQDLRSGRPRQ